MLIEKSFSEAQPNFIDIVIKIFSASDWKIVRLPWDENFVNKRCKLMQTTFSRASVL